MVAEIARYLPMAAIILLNGGAALLFGKLAARLGASGMWFGIAFWLCLYPLPFLTAIPIGVLLSRAKRAALEK